MLRTALGDTASITKRPAGRGRADGTDPPPIPSGLRRPGGYLSRGNGPDQ